MNFKLLTHVVSILIFIVSLFMLVPMYVAWYYDEQSCISSFLIPILFSLFLAAISFIATKKHHVRQLTNKEGFLLVGLSWVSASLIGALPFYISKSIPNFADAFFETISGFTTTGASILTAIEPLPKSMLFWRSLTHWLGGMGIVVLTVAIFPLLGISGLKLLKAEAPGPSVDKISTKIAGTAKILWLIYFSMTVLETLLLYFGGMNLFDSLTHTFGTLATGGFSPKNASMGFYQSPFLHYVVTAFMIGAGLNFALYYKLITGNLKEFWNNTEMKIYLGIFLTASVLITVSLYGNNVYNSISESFQFASFQVASILTTTGYATTDFAKWPSFAQIILFLMMFIGGCAGSTGGGIKVIRIYTLFKLGINEMKRILHPRSIFYVRLNGSIVKKDIIYGIAGFFFLYVIMLLLTTTIVAFSGHDVLTSFTTALATVGNIGPGFGLVGPACNYAFFSDAVKWYLSFAMLVGRLEVYTILVILTPHFWKSN